MFTQFVMPFGPIKVESIPKGWTPLILQTKTGYFFLDEVASICEDINTARVKAKVFDMLSKGLDPLEIMGVCRPNNQCWVVCMEPFFEYYMKNLQPRVREVKEGWNGNQLLLEKGLFYLSDVCKKIPFTPQQFRYQVSKNPDSRRTIGVWKDDELGTYLVDMEPFRNWVAYTWLVEVTGRLPPDTPRPEQMDRKG